MQVWRQSDRLQAAKRAFEPLIDVATAAALLKLHPKTLQRMARGGDVPAVRIGRFWRFRASQLDSWIESQVDSNRQPCRSEFPILRRNDAGTVPTR